MDFFVVDFDEAASYKMRFGSIIFCDSDDLAECSGYYAAGLFCISSHHCVGLTATCLSIRENRAIVAV